MDHPSQHSQIQLDYFNSAANRPVFPPARKETSYRIALGCWLIPLALGFCNFLLWCITRSPFLKQVGIAIVASGGVAGAVSLFIAAYFLVARLRAGARIWKEAFQPALALFGLLVLSLLLTIACCSAAYG